MLATGTSGLMSGEGKQPAASRPRCRALPRLYGHSSWLLQHRSIKPRHRGHIILLDPPELRAGRLDQRWHVAYTANRHHAAGTSDVPEKFFDHVRFLQCVPCSFLLTWSFRTWDM